MWWIIYFIGAVITAFGRGIYLGIVYKSEVPDAYDPEITVLSVFWPIFLVCIIGLLIWTAICETIVFIPKSGIMIGNLIRKRYVKNDKE